MTADGRLRGTFASLRVRNFRIYFATMVVSLSGTWMQSVAQLWLVLHLTGSGVALGITSALQFTPMLLLGAWGGLVADRADKRRLLLVTQSAAGVLALTLATLTLGGLVQVWMVWGLALLLGCVQVIDNPTRQSFIGEMVSGDAVPNAVSLNSAAFTAARVIGPALAGLTVAAVGSGWCFLVNGVSFFVVVGGLLLMRPAELHPARRAGRAPGQVRAGLAYAWRRRELRLPLLVMAAVGTLSFNFNVLLPLMARFAFRAGPETLGALLSFMAVGAFVGALLAAGRRHPSHRLVALATIGFGVSTLAAAAAPNLAVELAVLVLVGVTSMTLQATSNSLLQLNSDPALRGRVMALYMVVFVGTTPFGSPIAGWLGQTLGARAGLLLGGAAALAAGLVALLVVSRWRPAPAAAPVVA